jgi:hypothetical protein
VTSNIHRRRTPHDDHPALHWTGIRYEPVRTARSRLVPACPRCLAGTGITDNVTIRAAVDEPVCLRHRYWIIDDTPRHLDISAQEDLVTALTTVRKLRRRHGHDVFVDAFLTARQLCYHYRANVTSSRSQDDIQRRWIMRRKMLHADDQSLIVRYPEMITLAGSLCSRHWLDAAARPFRRPPLRGQRPDSEDFLREVARRLRHPDPDKFVRFSGSIGGLVPADAPKLKWGYYPQKANTPDDRPP